jgi:adenosylmethionine-8-amino-7-oxononanoate aminotransferase
MQSSTFRVFLDGRKLPVVESARGSTIFSDSKAYLDTTGGGTSYAVLGWNHEQVNTSMLAQLSKFGHIDYKIWGDPNVDSLANLLISKGPRFLSKVYFSGNSGAEACEAAMKMSFQYHSLKGEKKKKWFISRKQSYHGSTADALVLGDRPNLEFYKSMLSPYRTQVEMHHYKKCALPGESEGEYSTRCANELEKRILEIGAENVAGFVGETIMGGLVGDVPPVGDYWKKISDVCKRYNVHLILDEVYCGTGTSGTYFCIEQDGAEADFIFMGKTLAGGYGAISAVATTKEIHDGISNSFEKRLQHTTTHQAHSLSVAAALSVQSIVSDPNFLQSVREKGSLFRNLLEDSLEGFEFIKDIRGRGLRFSIEHSIDNQVEFGKRFESYCANNYQVLVNAKWHRICFTPPLIITEDEIQRAVHAVSATFKSLYREFI